MGLLVMNEKERLAKALMQMVVEKKLKLTKVATQLSISYRQVKRIYKRYKEEGDAGLVHKGRGRESNRKHSAQEKIIARYKEKYLGFGPTLAAEYLAEEDGLMIDHETLRRMLLANGLWHKQRKRSPYRRQRECRAQFGELLQLDGSIHDWLSEGRHTCLINLVDDATKKTLSNLESGETTAGVFRVLWYWIEKYGIPLALYVDLKNVYISPKAHHFSHVARACEKLGIKIIKAYSPQAKGRVERNHAVYQDRFIKELQLKKVHTIEGANQILHSGFIEKLNQKFEVPAREPISAHRLLDGIDLNQVLCWEYQRQVQQDWTFGFAGQYYQIEKQYGSWVKPKAQLIVRRHLDGSTSAWYKNEKLQTRLLAAKPKHAPKESVSSLHKKTVAKPCPSPWHESNSFLFKAG